MIISVINHTDGEVTDKRVQEVIRAINRQISEDFAPYWGMSARLRLEGRTPGAEPNPDHDITDMRGDAVLYLWNELDPKGALGYHDQNDKGIPYGIVFTKLSDSIDEDWSVTLSHEALELIADPEANLLVKGPHPKDPAREEVFHWYEMCDAVQTETYEIDGVKVSNFVLPLYFTGGDEVSGRNDFLGTLAKGATAGSGGSLKSFGVNPGGYVGFYDTQLGDWDTYHLAGDAKAEKRLDLKEKAGKARRANRYREPNRMRQTATTAKLGATTVKR